MNPAVKTWPPGRMTRGGPGIGAPVRVLGGAGRVGRPCRVSPGALPGQGAGGLDAELSDGDQVVVLPAVAGGALPA